MYENWQRIYSYGYVYAYKHFLPYELSMLFLEERAQLYFCKIWLVSGDGWKDECVPTQKRDF